MRRADQGTLIASTAAEGGATNGRAKNGMRYSLSGRWDFISVRGSGGIWVMYTKRNGLVLALLR